MQRYTSENMAASLPNPSWTSPWFWISILHVLQRQMADLISSPDPLRMPANHFTNRSARRCVAGSRLIQGATCQVNLCPIQLILRRLHFLVGGDEVSGESANSLSPSRATCCHPSKGAICRFCHIMTPRDSLAAFFSQSR